jgi:hypothetical protein
VLYNFVHEGKAWRLNSRHQVRKMGDHVALRPTLVGVLGSQQRANDARGFGRTEVGSAARLHFDRLLTGALD